MKSNRIPRQFKQITGKMLIGTNVNEAGDIFYVTKSERGYSAFNERTKEQCHCFVSMIRNSQIFQIIKID